MADHEDESSDARTAREDKAIEGSGAVYADALWRVCLVLDHVEAWLGSLADGTPIIPEQALLEVAGVHAVYDQVALALGALEALGILRKRAGPVRVLDSVRLAATRPFRTGVRVGLQQARAMSRADEVPRLVAALPQGLSVNLAEALRREADDLRSALIALITGAREEIVLASPFWDDDTVNDLEDLLARRLDAGIRVAVLGRRPQDEARGPPRGFARLAHSLSAHRGFRALVWEEPLPDDPFGTQTFHFKCIVVDRGWQAYLGTANLTLASLRSRMELGTILTGEPAQRLFRIVVDILSIAYPWCS